MKALFTADVFLIAAFNWVDLMSSWDKTRQYILVIGNSFVAI